MLLLLFRSSLLFCSAILCRLKNKYLFRPRSPAIREGPHHVRFSHIQSMLLRLPIHIPIFCGVILRRVILQDPFQTPLAGNKGGTPSRPVQSHTKYAPSPSNPHPYFLLRDPVPTTSGKIRLKSKYFPFSAFAGGVAGCKEKFFHPPDWSSNFPRNRIKKNLFLPFTILTF